MLVLYRNCIPVMRFFLLNFFLREQMEKFKSVVELVKQLKPTEPVYCIRRKSIKISSKYFKDKFPGKILYAVKTNPNPIVLKTIIESGINHFDIAAEDLRLATRHLGMIVGKVDVEEILGSIFSDFCIGK